MALEMLLRCRSSGTDTHKVEPGDAQGTAQRLDQIGWSIVAVTIGTIWLVPGVSGAWLIGSGILLLALNGIRTSLGIAWTQHG